MANKLALITGGYAGIGRGIAEALCKEKIDVVICGRNEDKTLKAAQKISDTTGGNCLGVPCDVRDLDSVKHMVELATEVGTSKLDIVINNAGLARFAPIQELEPETWNQVIDTNLTGTFNVIHASLPHMAEKGYIFNIESIAAVRAFATGAAYNASKAAVHAMSEAMMLDLRDDGIKVISVLPGSVNTRLMDDIGSEKEPWKLEPEDVARVIVDCLAFPERALPSKIEIRPAQPKQNVS